MKRLLIVLAFLLSVATFITAEGLMVVSRLPMPTFQLQRDQAPMIWMDAEDLGATLPETTYMLDGNDLVVTHNPKWILADDGEGIRFKIFLDDVRLKNFAPKEKVWPAILGIISGALISVVADEVLPLAPFAKQAAATCIGAAGGIAVWWVFR